MVRIDRLVISPSKQANIPYPMMKHLSRISHTYPIMKHLPSYIAHLQFRGFLVDKLLYVGVLLLPSGLSFQSLLGCLYEVSSYL